eukprot:10792565-Alexandrium_andersonii.AAC.1
MNTACARCHVTHLQPLPPALWRQAQLRSCLQVYRIACVRTRMYRMFATPRSIRNNDAFKVDDRLCSTRTSML